MNIHERLFTSEISSWDETRVWMKSSLYMVKCLLLFTLCCRDKILSPNELIPVKKKEMEFLPGIKKQKKRRVNASSRNEILKRACSFNF